MRVLSRGSTACLLAAVASVVAATFDPLSGAGLLSAAEVQAPLGWTDAQFQARAAGVSFHHRSSGRYSAVCSWSLPQGGAAQELRHPAFNRESALTSALRYHPQQPHRIDGFHLLGFAQAPANDAAPPVVGTPCSAPGGLPGTWSAVTPQVQSRALVARYGGVDTVLPF